MPFHTANVNIKKKYKINATMTQEREIKYTQVMWLGKESFKHQ